MPDLQRRLQDPRRPGLIDGTKLAREQAAQREVRARRIHTARSVAAGAFYGVAFALAVASMVAADGLPWLCGAFVAGIVGAFLHPEDV